MFASPRLEGKASRKQATLLQADPRSEPVAGRRAYLAGRALPTRRRQATRGRRGLPMRRGRAGLDARAGRGVQPGVPGGNADGIRRTGRESRCRQTERPWKTRPPLAGKWRRCWTPKPTPPASRPGRSSHLPNRGRAGESRRRGAGRRRRRLGRHRRLGARGQGRRHHARQGADRPAPYCGRGEETGQAGASRVRSWRGAFVGCGLGGRRGRRMVLGSAS